MGASAATNIIAPATRRAPKAIAACRGLIIGKLRCRGIHFVLAKLMSLRPPWWRLARWRYQTWDPRYFQYCFSATADRRQSILRLVGEPPVGHFDAVSGAGLVADG